MSDLKPGGRTRSGAANVSVKQVVQYLLDELAAGKNFVIVTTGKNDASVSVVGDGGNGTAMGLLNVVARASTELVRQMDKTGELEKHPDLKRALAHLQILTDPPSGGVPPESV